MKRMRLFALLLSCSVLSAWGDLTLFDPTMKDRVTAHPKDNAKVEWKDSCVEFKTPGNRMRPGVTLRGEWDLEEIQDITIDLVSVTGAWLPMRVCLSNEEIPDFGKGAFIQKFIIQGKGDRPLKVTLPPTFPNRDDILPKLVGMRDGPMSKYGASAPLRSYKIRSISVYVKTPTLKHTLQIRKITARKGPHPAAEPWMNLTADEFFPFIDKYGQFKYREWPGKIHSDAELIEAREAEKKDLAAHPGPKNWSKFGGWADGPRMKATGYFRVEKVDGKWWMVDPEGYLYWSHGPVRVTPSTAITPLDKREFFFTDLPEADSPFAFFYTTRDELLYPYYQQRKIKRTYDFSSANCYRKYGKDWFNAFAGTAHRRLRSWGCNTIANSSDIRICRMRRTPYTDRFELKSKRIAGSKGGWWPFRDPFDPSFREEVRRQMALHQEEMRDPWCFGFFVDNELGWGKSTSLALWTLQSPADQAAKVEFVKRLKKQYQSIDRLNAAWRSSYADWDALLVSRKGPDVKNAKKDLESFTSEIAEAYFRNIREEFKKAAPNKLYMGCRYGGALHPLYAVRAAAKYCDIISCNVYAREISWLKLPEGIDKPMIIGEFHFGALDRGLFHPGLVHLKNQEERGAVYVQYVTSALKHPQVVGVHWHQFGDQATTGRFDGECFQVGFVDCCDTPYPETRAGLRKVGYDLYRIRSGK